MICCLRLFFSHTTVVLFIAKIHVNLDQPKDNGQFLIQGLSDVVHRSRMFKSIEIKLAVPDFCDVLLDKYEAVVHDNYSVMVKMPCMPYAFLHEQAEIHEEHKDFKHPIFATSNNHCTLHIKLISTDPTRLYKYFKLVFPEPIAPGNYNDNHLKRYTTVIKYKSNTNRIKMKGTYIELSWFVEIQSNLDNHLDRGIAGITSGIETISTGSVTKKKKKSKSKSKSKKGDDGDVKMRSEG